MERYKHGGKSRERTRRSLRLSAKRKPDVELVASAGRRRLNYEEPVVAEGSGALIIRPRPVGARAKKARGDSRRSQTINIENTGPSFGGFGLMADMLGSASNEDTEPVVQRRQKPVNGFSGTIPAGVNIFRCNVQAAFFDFDGLDFTQAHYALLRKTPFRFFFRALKEISMERFHGMCMKSEEGIRLILEMFDVNRKCFIFGDVEGRLSREDLILIFGVCCGDKPVPVKHTACSAKAPWLLRCFRKDLVPNNKGFALRKTTLLTKLQDLILKDDDVSVADTVRLVMAYLMATVFAPNMSFAIPFYVADYLEDLSKVCDYDWASYFLDVLLEGICLSANLKAGGCVIHKFCSFLKNLCSQVHESVVAD